MLTGRKEIDDKLTNLDGGADDYIVKPVDMRELSARMRSVLRRPQEMRTQLQIGPLTRAMNALS